MKNCLNGILFVLALAYSSTFAEVPDSLIPKLRWDHPSFPNVLAVSPDGRRMLLTNAKLFGIWNNSQNEVSRSFPIGGGSVLSAVFTKGDTSINALVTDYPFYPYGSTHVRGGSIIGFDSIPVKLYRYSLTSKKRTFIGSFNTRGHEIVFFRRRIEDIRMR